MALRGKAAGDDAAQLGVLGRVDVEQDQPLHLDRLAGHALGEPDQRGVLPGRVDLRRLGDRHDVGVPGDRPVPFVVEPGGSAALRDPPDRGRAAQLGQFLGGHPGRVDLRIGEVEARRDVRHGHGCLPWPLVERVLVLITPRILEASHGHCGDRRGGADPDRQAGRRAGRPARRRTPGRHPGRPARARGHRASRRRAGGRRLRDAGGRAVQQRHQDRLAARRAPLPGRLPDARRPVRFGAAGGAPGGRAHRGGRDRRRDRVRGGGDEPGAAGDRRPGGRRLAPARLVGHRHAEPVRRRRAHRAAARALPRRRRRVRPALADPGPGRLGAGPVRPGGGAGQGAGRGGDPGGGPGRGAAGDQPGRAGPAQAGGRGRPAHGRHVVADLRRRGRRAAGRRGPGPVARPAAPGPDPRAVPGRRRTVLPPRRPGPGDRAGARTQRHDHRATSTCSRSTRRSRRWCCPGWPCTGPTPAG